MKLLIASDIHGSAVCCRRLLERFEAEQADRMLFLGDILYHGPRNDLPEGYAPKDVIAMLNEKKELIYAVRGNCEAEVDQMVLQFPVMADYGILPLGEKMVYFTHGHVYNEEHLPPMMKGDILLHGHTHILKAEKRETYTLLNPGSVSIPKGGNPRTYATLENGVFRILTLDGEEVTSLDLN